MPTPLARLRARLLTLHGALKALTMLLIVANLRLLPRILSMPDAVFPVLPAYTCPGAQCTCVDSVEAWKPLKIAGFTKAWSTHSYGGLGRHADNLYRSLAQKGHTVHVFTSSIAGGRSQDVEVDGRLIIHYSPVGSPGNGADFAFQKWTRPAFDTANASLPGHGFDVIHLESQPVFLPHFENITIPVVPSWHGVLFDLWREHSMRGVLQGGLTDAVAAAKVVEFGVNFRSQLATFKRLFKYHIVLTERARLDLIRSYNMAPDRVVIIHHSMPVDVYATDTMTNTDTIRLGTRQQWRIPSDALVVGFASKLQEAKGVDFLLKAVPHIIALSPNVWFVIAGSGSEGIMAKVKALAASASSHGRLIVLGPLASSDMPQFYSAIDVFFDSSMHHTGSNGVLVEAMLSGVGVVAGDVGSVSLTNMGVGGDTDTNSSNDSTSSGCCVYGAGSVSGAVDGVKKALGLGTRGEVGQRWRQAGRERALSGFDLSDMIDRYEAVFRKAISEGVRLQNG